MCALTKNQILRQDFVDNQIFELINSLLPRSKQMAWDIEVIGNIRNVIRQEAEKKLGSMNEMQFYPFIEV